MALRWRLDIGRLNFGWRREFFIDESTRIDDDVDAIEGVRVLNDGFNVLSSSLSIWNTLDKSSSFPFWSIFHGVTISSIGYKNLFIKINLLWIKSSYCK